jgi:glutaredoxin-related protein
MADPELKSKIEELIQANPVLLFMKGTPDMPRCGFSMRVVQVLDQVDVDYGAIDVLPALQPLREVTAEISDWQTFPQLCQRRAARRLRPRRGDVRVRRTCPGPRRRATRRDEGR